MLKRMFGTFLMVICIACLSGCSRARSTSGMMEEPPQQTSPTNMNNVS